MIQKAAAVNTVPKYSAPSLRSLIRGGNVLLEQFDSKKTVFLDDQGIWQKNPSRLIHRISNEILFFLWSLNRRQRIFFFAHIFFPLAQKFWPTIKWIKTYLVSGLQNHTDNIDEQIFKIYKNSSLSADATIISIILDSFIWALGYEAVRISASSFVSSWDLDGQKLKQEKNNQIIFWDGLMQAAPVGIDVKGFISISLVESRSYFPTVTDPLLKLIADEEKIYNSIKRLSDQIKTIYDQDEIGPLIIEKIQPTQGIVTQTSPALLRPCLDLLNDDNFEISSGIAYQSSVILSILQDPRSLEGILFAMDKIALQFTKIRENLIYTLGNLKAPEATSILAQILDGPDEIVSSKPDEPPQSHLLIEQKAEIIRSLGRIGLDSISCLDSLIKYIDHSSDKLKTYLAWSLGSIGYEQKKAMGGVSADILISLLKLMKMKSRQVFEEAVNALRKIEMPEFIHSLHLYDVGAVNILGLKPAKRGLYELSETIHYLIKKQGRAVIAVNGDSGTGKTYFCQSLLDGLGEIGPDDILYLMRDRKKDQKIFNRILGLKWLKNYIEPSFYQDYPKSIDEDDPKAYFQNFMHENQHKKLIILDGCRDGTYFQRVIDLFYIQGVLDIEVNFRATFSTRRTNLEEREVALESIKTHLAFLEEPILEDTKFYQEGKIILYDLDNSLSSRLNRTDIRDLFQTNRIASWGELALLGEFPQEKSELQIDQIEPAAKTENFSLIHKHWPGEKTYQFRAKEKKFQLELNENLDLQPHLLFSVDIDDLKPSRLRFYAQNQIAGIGETGNVFILTFIDNRIFFTDIENISEIKLWGRDIFMLSQEGRLMSISFEKNIFTVFNSVDSRACSLKPIDHHRILTGHEDGTINIWDFSEKEVIVFKAHDQAVLSLTCDYDGRFYSGSSEGGLKKWDLEKGTSLIWSGIHGRISRLYAYDQDTLLAIGEQDSGPDSNPDKKSIRFILIKNTEEKAAVFMPKFMEELTGLHIQKDGRIISSFHSKDRTKIPDSLIIFYPEQNKCAYSLIPGHRGKTTDCLVMGPKIISCGLDSSDTYSLKSWGTEYSVKTELGKLKMLQQ